MAEEGQSVIIVRRKKGGGEGHHGGAWKVAYADFVTAMMAFFLLLWLLNATTTEQKLGISNYFDPAGAVKNQGGGDGVLAGQSPAPSGAQRSASAPIAVMVPLATKPSSGDAEDTTDDPNVKQKTQKEPTEEELEAAMAKKEQSDFEKAEAVLRQAIQSVPELKDLADSLKIDQTPEGLRIQILDQDKMSMFAKGGSRLEPDARRLLGLVASAIKGLPNKLTLSGHTDSVPYQTVTGYTNWELSADRANASRKALIEAGVAPERIAQVVGKADRDHLFPEDPTSPRNRRISIVLQRETPIPTASKPPAKATQKAEETIAPAEAKLGPIVSQPPVPGTLGKAAPRVIERQPAKRP